MESICRPYSSARKRDRQKIRRRHDQRFLLKSRVSGADDPVRETLRAEGLLQLIFDQLPGISMFPVYHDNTSPPRA